jgi:hypothetical protein
MAREDDAYDMWVIDVSDEYMRSPATPEESLFGNCLAAKK